MGDRDNDRGLALAVSGNAFISIWKEPSTLERLARVREVEQALVDRSPSGIIVLTVLIDSPSAIRAGEPEAASKLAKHFAATTRAHAYSIEGTGFRAAALRAVIAGVNIITRTGHPTKVFDETSAAIRWLAPYGNALTATALEAAVAEARARML
jgi:hypothetical protein